MMTAQPINMRLLHTVMVYARIAPRTTTHQVASHSYPNTCQLATLGHQERCSSMQPRSLPLGGQSYCRPKLGSCCCTQGAKLARAPTQAHGHTPKDDPECCSPHNCTRTWGHLQMLIATDQRQGNSHTYSTHDNRTSCSAFSDVLKYTWRDCMDPPRSTTAHRHAHGRLVWRAQRERTTHCLIDCCHHGQCGETYHPHPQVPS
jgi:hypothetical protein